MMHTTATGLETVIVMETVPIRFGVGATEEVGYEAQRLGMRRVLLVTDRRLHQFGLIARVAAVLHDAGVAVTVYDDVQIEPTDRSFAAAIAAGREAEYDGFVALGGGSVIDTAKAVNLYTSHPAPLLDYINRPIGAGKPVPGPLKPLIAIPTTAGTGSEATPVIVLDLLDLKLKTGISHRFIRPSVAVIDPLNALSQPPFVTAASGCDVLCHALESYTSRPYNTRPRAASPAERPAYIGANPIADIWCEQAIRYGGRYLRRAFTDGADLEARTYTMLAATFAGIGFGNAGVHIPHAMAYPVAGLVKQYHPPDFPGTEPIIPHGLSVIVNAPAAFRFTAPAWPERHARAAELLGVDTGAMTTAEAAGALADALVALMQDLRLPNGLAALGYTEADLPDLVAGARKQERLLVNAPRTPDETELTELFRAAMHCW
jgi:hydroxyacid-oxoacid transhydrogenase